MGKKFMIAVVVTALGAFVGSLLTDWYRSRKATSSAK